MDKFLAGMIAGVLLERFHLIQEKPAHDVVMGAVPHMDFSRPEALMTDLFFIALGAGGFAFFAWAVRALNS